MTRRRVSTLKIMYLLDIPLSKDVDSLCKGTLDVVVGQHCIIIILVEFLDSLCPGTVDVVVGQIYWWNSWAKLQYSFTSGHFKERLGPHKQRH